jgi:flagellar hook-basal body complex protein FliE
MTIIPGLQSNVQTNPSVNLTKKVNEQVKSFDETLKEFVSDVNSLQTQATDATNKMISGEPIDVHEVMAAAEKAKTSFELLMELRNKTIDAYRELIRIQV